MCTVFPCATASFEQTKPNNTRRTKNTFNGQLWPLSLKPAPKIIISSLEWEKGSASRFSLCQLRTRIKILQENRNMYELDKGVFSGSVRWTCLLKSSFWQHKKNIFSKRVRNVYIFRSKMVSLTRCCLQVFPKPKSFPMTICWIKK